jgi:hypothetical protein
VVVAPTDLPPDLAFYLLSERAGRPVVDLTRDPAVGLRRLLDEVEAVPRKRIARPRRLVAWLVAVALFAAAVIVAAKYVLG